MLASLYTKNCKIHIDKVNYIRDQPITLHHHSSTKKTKNMLSTHIWNISNQKIDFKITWIM